MSPSLHGVVLVDKPAGFTSHAVVKRVKKVLQVSKAGHTGTLDPFATGILPVCLNEGTKLVPFLPEEEKEYEAVLCLGTETDTGDFTGRVIEPERPSAFRSDEIESAFAKFRGRILQTPPMYSALKHQGVPLYRLARQGQEVPRAERQVDIRVLTVLKVALPRVFFRVVCSRGTYVRTLASDIGKILGCGAHLLELRRLRSGHFLLANALSLDALVEQGLAGIRERGFISLAEALPSLPAVKVSEAVVACLRQGQEIASGDLPGKEDSIPGPQDRWRILNPDGDLIAVVEAAWLPNSNGSPAKAVWRPLRVFYPER